MQDVIVTRHPCARQVPEKREYTELLKTSSQENYSLGKNCAGPETEVQRRPRDAKGQLDAEDQGPIKSEPEQEPKPGS